MRRTALALLLAPLSVATAQTGYHLKADSRLIQTTLIVRNQQGVPVTDLPQSAFHAREDGVDQNYPVFRTAA